MHPYIITCKKLYILCWLITCPQSGGRGGGAFLGALILILAHRRAQLFEGGAYSRGHLFKDL